MSVTPSWPAANYTSTNHIKAKSINHCHVLPRRRADWWHPPARASTGLHSHLQPLKPASRAHTFHAPWSAALSSCSSSGAGLGCNPASASRRRTCWTPARGRRCIWCCRSRWSTEAASLPPSPFFTVGGEEGGGSEPKRDALTFVKINAMERVYILPWSGSWFLFNRRIGMRGARGAARERPVARIRSGSERWKWWERRGTRARCVANGWFNWLSCSFPWLLLLWWYVSMKNTWGCQKDVFFKNYLFSQNVLAVLLFLNIHQILL